MKIIFKILIILILIFSLSYNIYQYEWNKNYGEVKTSVFNEFKELEKTNLTQEQKELIEKAEKKVKFMGGLCFN